MGKSKNQIKTYIKHAEATKKRYEKANLFGQHTAKIEKMAQDIQNARRYLKMG